MMEEPVERLLAAVETARSGFHQLVLVVAPANSGKTRLLRHLSRRGGWPVLNLSLELAAALLEFSERDRRLRSPAQLVGLINRHGGEESAPVLLDDIELLFEPSLALDPLRALQQSARRHLVVATWPGAIAGGMLTYATPGHPEHRTYPAADLLLVTP